MTAPSDAPFRADDALLSQLPAESAVVALIAAGASGDAALRDALRRPLDWERLVSLGARERALVPLHERFVAVPFRVARTEDLARLQRLALVSEFQLTSLHDRLVRMLALFAENGVEVLLLKGAGLAYSAYPTPTARPMGDIDVLVRDEVATEAWELARANGWTRRSDVPEERSYEDHQHLTPLEDADGLQIGLELHTALFTNQAPFRLPASQMWESARRLTIGGQPALVPSPEDQLLHAALHFAWSHEMTFGAWRTLRDVERIVATGEPDWSVVVQKARACRGATCMYWTLRLARDLAGVEVPPHVLEALAPRLPATVLRMLTRYYAVHALPNPDAIVSSVSLSRTLWSLGIRPRSQGHGRSRPWLDTEEWVRGPEGMRSGRTSSARRFLQQSFGFLRSIASLFAS
jgi:hypothetical protein